MSQSINYSGQEAEFEDSPSHLPKALRAQPAPSTNTSNYRSSLVSLVPCQRPLFQPRLHHGPPVTQAVFPNIKYIIPLSPSSPQACSSSLPYTRTTALCLSPLSLKLLEGRDGPPPPPTTPSSGEHNVQRGGSSVNACGSELDRLEHMGLLLILCLLGTCPSRRICLDFLWKQFQKFSNCNGLT